MKTILLSAVLGEGRLLREKAESDLYTVAAPEEVDTYGCHWQRCYRGKRVRLIAEIL